MVQSMEKNPGAGLREWGHDPIHDYDSMTHPIPLFQFLDVHMDLFFVFPMSMGCLCSRNNGKNR